MNQTKCRRALSKVKKELGKMEVTLSESYNAQRAQKEAKMVRNIKSNPNSFYSHARCFRKVDTFTNKEGEVINDDKGLPSLLSDQYGSMFSSPNPEAEVKDTEDFFITKGSRMECNLYS